MQLLGNLACLYFDSDAVALSWRGTNDTNSEFMCTASGDAEAIDTFVTFFAGQFSCRTFFP